MNIRASVKLLWTAVALGTVGACGGGGASVAQAPAPLSAPAPAPAPVPAPASAQAFALMDSGDGASAFDNYLSLTQVDGIAVRTSWQALAPARGSYDWTSVDAAVAAASSH